MSTTVLGRLFQMITILAEKTSRDHKKLLKFGVHVDPGLFLPADQKLAPKWASTTLPLEPAWIFGLSVCRNDVLRDV